MIAERRKEHMVCLRFPFNEVGVYAAPCERIHLDANDIRYLLCGENIVSRRRANTQRKSFSRPRIGQLKDT